jgi:membrane protein DedA with SNARE-associated domain
MTESLQQLSPYLDAVFHYGAFWVYLVIFLACFFENIFPPFPGDSFIIAAGGLVAVGRLHIVPTALVIVAGGMCSAMMLYFLGRNYGRDYFIRKNFKLFSADDVVAMEGRLQKWGALVLLVSRFIFGIRSGIAVAAGIGRYPAIRMFTWTLVSYLAFVSLWLLVGIKVVNHLDVIEYYWQTYSRIIWPIIVLGALLWLLRRYRLAKRKS